MLAIYHICGLFAINDSYEVDTLTLEEYNVAKSTGVTGIVALEELAKENTKFGYKNKSTTWCWLGTSYNSGKMLYGYGEDNANFPTYARYFWTGTFGIRPVITMIGISLSQDSNGIWRIIE